MRCYCGGGAMCFCRLNYVIYKLKCNCCNQAYIGKTIRELWIRISEHLRAIVKGVGSALAKHKCNGGFSLRILARTKNNSTALKICEGKMIRKYGPKINIRNEKKAQEIAKEMGRALRNKESCPRDINPHNHPNDDYEDDYEYWIEESDDISQEVERENENGDGMTEEEAEKNQSQGATKEQSITFDTNNYILLAAIKANGNINPFVTMELNSAEAKEMGVILKEKRSWAKKFWYATPIGIWFDDEKTLKQKFLNLGINVGVIAISIAIPIGAAALASSRAVATTGTAVASATAGETAAVAVASETAVAAAVAGTTSVLVAKLAVKTALCTAAFAVPAMGAAAPVICAMA